MQGLGAELLIFTAKDNGQTHRYYDLRHDQLHGRVAPEAGVQPQAKTEVANAQAHNLHAFTVESGAIRHESQYEVP